MTPDQIHPGHTYETKSGHHARVISVDVTTVCFEILQLRAVSATQIHLFAAACVRDVTPAPESDQGEKVAQAQSQGASRGCGVAELTADDWMQIEMAAKGCVSGTSDEWPELSAAIAKLRGKPFVRRVSSAWLEGFCMGAMSMRRTPPAAAVNAELLDSLKNLVELVRSVEPGVSERIDRARAAIARAEAGTPGHPRFRHRRTGDIYELLLIANEHAERTAQYPPTAVYRRVSDRTVWSRPVQDWGKDFEEVTGNE